MASTISFGDANSGLEAGVIHGSVNAEFHHHHPPERSETLPDPSAVIPFARDQDFVERGSLLDEVFHKCAVPGSRTALVGLGGVGKSQLAIEHIYRTRERSPGTWIFWVYASSVARFEQSYRDIADHLKIPGRKDPKANILKLVRDWLHAGKYGPWLLVLDNVDDTHLDTHLSAETGGGGQGVRGTAVGRGVSQPMSAYLPQSQNGSILITSRNRGIALKLVEENNIIVVEKMAQAHALTLFEKKLGSLGDGNDIVELAEALEYMPLAIVQSTAYVCQSRPRYSVRQYLEDFRKSDRKKTSLLNYEAGLLRRDWEASNSIIVTWQISFEYIRRNWPSAADLLSLMSFFDRQGIPEYLIRDRDDGLEDDGSEDAGSKDDGFEDDVQVLRNYSFISCDTDQTFEMHALVQLAMRKWLEANNQLELWKEQYVQSLSAAFPSGEYKNWAICQALFPHAKLAVTQRPKAEASLREWAFLMYNAARYAYEKGNTAEAVQLSRTALEVNEKVYGHEHENTLASMGMLGSAYFRRGQWKQAEEFQVEAIEIRKRVLGEEHPDTLVSMGRLASLYLEQGCYKEAEELGEEVIEIEKRVLGEEHPDTLVSIGNLAFLYSEQGRYKEAEELGVKVLEIEKRVLGEEHPNTLVSIGNLAFLYSKQGCYKEAEELGVKVLEIEKRVLGEEHPITLNSIGHLAFLYSEQGRYKEAEELVVEVLELQKRVLGEEHPHTLSNMQTLAWTWKGQGRDTEAIQLMEERIQLQIGTLGADHPDTSEASEILTRWQRETFNNLCTKQGILS
ncbi:MAG: hypothetical protein LQ352_003037 [Teloschistes flavicans]|nr:MAG: hypothetical protein LQ352_003037 [Teloschistes flavicans]